MYVEFKLIFKVMVMTRVAELEPEPQHFACHRSHKAN
jgi:hypothetical protein